MSNCMHIRLCIWNSKIYSNCPKDLKAKMIECLCLVNVVLNSVMTVMFILHYISPLKLGLVPH